MRRARIIEDWSRFNQSVLEVANGLPELVARTQNKSQQSMREPPELASRPGDAGDTHGLIIRHKWRKHA